MNKEYFKYLLISKKSLLVFIGVINFLFPTLIYFLSLSDGWYYNIASNIVLISSALIFIECILLPVIYFSFLHNKKGVDTYFSLPISHKEIYITTYILVVLEIVIPHILATIPIVVWEYVLGEAVMYVAQFFLYIVGCMFVVSCIVLAVCALILKTNTVIDSLIMVGSYIVSPLLIYIALYMFIDTQAYGVNAHMFLREFASYAFLPIVFIKSYPSFFMNIFELHDYIFDFDEYGMCFLIFLCVGIIAFISCIIDMKKRKAEDAEQLSTNIFTYPFIIALVTFTLLISVIFSSLGFSTTAIYIVAIFILFSIMVCVYKRKITFTKKSVILFVCTILLGYGTMFASSATKAFGLEESYRYQNTLDNLCITWSMDFDYEDFNVFISSKEAEDDVIKNEVHGEYKYKDLIDKLHKIQDEHLLKYYNEEADFYTESDENEIYNYFDIGYKGNKVYTYSFYEEMNSENIETIIDSIKFYDQFSFLEVELRYVYRDADGKHYDKNLTKDEFYEKLLKAVK